MAPARVLVGVRWGVLPLLALSGALLAASCDGFARVSEPAASSTQALDRAAREADSRLGSPVAHQAPSGSAPQADAERTTALFAGGCFWCMEPPFEKVEGVLSVESGYAGGQVQNPTYEQVSRGGTGHLEVVRITFEPSRVSYQQLLELFWRNIDPLQQNGQFCDHGPQYRSAIFALTPAQKSAALASREQVARELGAELATQVLEPAEFYPAEDYHQDYYKKNPLRYRYYRFACGRDRRLEQLWGEKN